MSKSREATEQMLAQITGIDQEEASQRLTQTVSIVHADSASAGQLAKELAEQLERTVTLVPDGTPADLEIAIGTQGRGDGRKSLFLGISPEALVSSTQVPQEASAEALHGLKITVAGCYAAAPALHILLDMSRAGFRQEADFKVRFADLGITDDLLDRNVSMDGTVLAGAGAIGNAFARAARHLKVQGKLIIVDPKNVGESNPNRCLYFEEADEGEPKAPLLANKATPDFPNLVLEPYVGTFSEFVKAKGQVRRVLVATDSPRVRRTIQKDLPLEVVDASTTDIREIQVHSHRYPTDGACLACIYHPNPVEQGRERDIANALGVSVEVVSKGIIDADAAALIAGRYPQFEADDLVGTAFDSQFRALCATGSIKTETNVQVLTPFAFVSNLAGALLALEILRQEAGISDSNFLFLSPWAPPSRRMRSWRNRVPNCEFCSDPVSHTVMRELWSESVAAE